MIGTLQVALGNKLVDVLLQKAFENVAHKQLQVGVLDVVSFYAYWLTFG